MRAPLPYLVAGPPRSTPLRRVSHPVRAAAAYLALPAASDGLRLFAVALYSTAVDDPRTAAEAAAMCVAHRRRRPIRPTIVRTTMASAVNLPNLCERATLTTADVTFAELDGPVHDAWMCAAGWRTAEGLRAVAVGVGTAGRAAFDEADALAMLARLRLRTRRATRG
ncbi:hypothetical protein SAMN05421812_101698 [Asanoa hainanensis]|uniref:Uncharacterized protein n=1 Tax=Asanoa hainanensis TaxID=560556 RepID=A0A239H840_9ACTN|nr:hypothetical protein [Asanoa hainanensis]SNS76424.1 hypothetical protein SAMN05421812_101698 [Asanoa hainanensis]